MIDGVCGGLAKFFGLDVTLIRIAWVLLTLIGGSGILLYLVAMIIMPKDPAPLPLSHAASERSTGANAKFWGILLVVIGVLWLLRNLDIPYYLSWWGFSWEYVLPALLIMAGVAFLYGGRAGLTNGANADSTGEPSAPEAVPGTAEHANTMPPAADPVLRLYRSRREKKLFGVCGGLASYLNVDPTIIRLLFVVAAPASFGFMILLYLAMAIIVPNEPLFLTASQPFAQTA